MPTRKQKEEREEAQITTAGRVVQLAAIAATVALVYIDIKAPTENIPDWIYGIMLATAYRANPSDISRILGGKK